MAETTGGPAGIVQSVNVGTVEHLMLNGRAHPTGIFKKPVAGSVHLGDSRVEGDVQADLSVHGGRDKAVYSYSAEDYSWWEQELARPLDPATFGENLTLAGVSTTLARIGEQWAVGGAILQVTQPRQPCWKLGAKMTDPKFPRLFRQAGRSGAYLSIVEEGDVGAGDPVEIVHRPDHPVTIGMVAWLNISDPKLAQLVSSLTAQVLSPREWDEVLGPLGLPESYPVWPPVPDD